MDTEFGQDLITITDEDGKEYELEILSTVEYNGSLYYALAPAETDDEEEELEVSILKAVQENGEEILCAVEDEEELEQVYELLIDQLYDEEDEEEL
ncbi:MAG: DUF1292 domain-containing protein [Ruminococcaceae bacterium]|nr:DUF1292 domain-containing protein [Oscillospiraceae bacterium]